MEVAPHIAYDLAPLAWTEDPRNILGAAAVGGAALLVLLGLYWLKRRRIRAVVAPDWRQKMIQDLQRLQHATITADDLAHLMRLIREAATLQGYASSRPDLTDHEFLQEIISQEAAAPQLCLLVPKMVALATRVKFAQGAIDQGEAEACVEGMLAYLTALSSAASLSRSSPA